MQYKRDYFVHYYDTDLRKKLLITSLMKFFEDIALLQSESVGLGLDYYKKNDVAWMLYKYDITIFRYPEFLETINVMTEPINLARFYAYRLFKVSDLKTGELYASGNSLWFFIDTKAKKPTKITRYISDGYQVPLDTKRELTLEDPGTKPEYSIRKDFHIRFGDIDTNNHVNNTKYVEWALEVVPFDIFHDYAIKRIKIIYKKEGNYGRKISSLAEVCPEGEKKVIYHKIMDDDQELCVLETVWEKV